VATFPVAAARVWNELPCHVTSEPHLQRIRSDSSRTLTYCFFVVMSISFGFARSSSQEKERSLFGKL